MIRCIAINPGQEIEQLSEQCFVSYVSFKLHMTTVLSFNWLISCFSSYFIIPTCIPKCSVSFRRLMTSLYTNKHYFSLKVACVNQCAKLNKIKFLFLHLIRVANIHPLIALKHSGYPYSCPIAFDCFTDYLIKISSKFFRNVFTALQNSPGPYLT